MDLYLDSLNKLGKLDYAEIDDEKLLKLFLQKRNRVLIFRGVPDFVFRGGSKKLKWELHFSPIKICVVKKGVSSSGAPSHKDVMPDYLHRAAPAYGTVASPDPKQDPDLEAERSWLLSSLRCYLDSDLPSAEAPFHDS